MSEHAEKGHPIGAVIMVVIIAGLVSWGISLMNDGNIVACSVAGVILALLGVYVVFGLGPDRA
jgi:hypothetical protein